MKKQEQVWNKAHQKLQSQHLYGQLVIQKSVILVCSEYKWHHRKTHTRTHTFSRDWSCCFCLSSRAWLWLCRDSLSSSILSTLSFSRFRSLSRSLMAASWVIWVACRLLIWPMTEQSRQTWEECGVSSAYCHSWRFLIEWCAKQTQRFSELLWFSFILSAWHHVHVSQFLVLEVMVCSFTVVTILTVLFWSTWKL